MKILRWILLLLVVALLCGGIWFWREASSFLETPPQTAGQDVYFDVPAGAALNQIAKELADRGLITDAGRFSLLARWKNVQNRLQAGRFQLNTGWLPEKVLETLVSGRPVMYRITIPEGLTWWQTAHLLEDAGFVRFSDFQAAVTDPAFLRHYGIPFASAEGFLMPDTYLLRKPDWSLSESGTTDGESTHDERWREQSRAVAGRMIDNFWRKANPLWPGQTEAQEGKIVRPLVADLKKWLILASIVEKETGVDAERPRVAGVYANRLAKKMLLQADPTVIYGMGEGFTGPLRKSDLANMANAYNTYQIAGLPPGPICSVGVAALKAAIEPEKHDYLYFVAAPEGQRHVFSRTYSEHEQAVREYRRQKQGG